jgi:hypothetical protein
MNCQVTLSKLEINYVPSDLERNTSGRSGGNIRRKITARRSELLLTANVVIERASSGHL